MSTFWSTYLVSIIVAILAVCSLGAAVALQLTGNDANNAWTAFGGFAVLFTGIHIPNPTMTTTTITTTDK